MFHRNQNCFNFWLLKPPLDSHISFCQWSEILILCCLFHCRKNALVFWSSHFCGEVIKRFLTNSFTKEEQNIKRNYVKKLKLREKIVEDFNFSIGRTQIKHFIFFNFSNSSANFNCQCFAKVNVTHLSPVRLSQKHKFLHYRHKRGMRKRIDREYSSSNMQMR